MKSAIDSQRLIKFDLFNGMTDEQVSRIANVMRLCNYEEGEVIITEGEIGSELFVLISGLIEISKSLTLQGALGTNRREKSLLKLSDSNYVFFGEMSLFGSDERSATVKAVTTTSLGVLTQEQVHSLAAEDPLLAYRLFYNIGRKLAEHLRRANRDILKLTTAFCLALEGI